MRTHQLALAALAALLGMSTTSPASERAPDELVTITIAGETLIEILRRLEADYGYSFGYPPFTWHRRGPHLYIEPTPLANAVQRLAEAYGLCGRVIVGLERMPKLVMLKECEAGEFGRVQEPYQIPSEDGEQRVWLGLAVRDGKSQGTSGTGNRGALVEEIAGEGTVAEAAGIRVGDTITAYNGTAIETRQHLAELVSKTKRGDEVAVIVLRDGRSLTLIARF